MQPSDTLLLVGDPINTPRDTLVPPSHQLSALKHVFLGCAEPSYTRVTKLGLIDPDNPTRTITSTHVERGITYSIIGGQELPRYLVRSPSDLVG